MPPKAKPFLNRRATTDDKPKPFLNRRATTEDMTDHRRYVANNSKEGLGDLFEAKMTNRRALRHVASLPLEETSAKSADIDNRKSGSDSRTRRPKIVSASMTSANPRLTSARSDPFEEKIRRKLAEGNNARNPTTTLENIDEGQNLEVRSSSENFDEVQKLGARSSLTSSMNVNDLFEEKIRKKLVEENTKKWNTSHPTTRESVYGSLGAEETEETKVEDGGAPSMTHVSFEDVFADLQRFQEENGTLSVSISDPIFGCIVDALSSAGMEVLMKKRWEDQVASLLTFRRAHGDCLVPEDHPTLGGWARMQCDHYKLYERQLPCCLTKKRFDKLKSVGFDKYVHWEEADKDSGNQKPSGQLKSSKGVKRGEAKKNAKTAKVDNAAAGEAEENFVDELTLDERIQKKKKRNSGKKKKEKGPKQRDRSLDPNKGETPEKVKVAAELFKKRMLKRNMTRGLTRQRSKKLLIVESIEEEGGEEGRAKGNEEEEAMGNLNRRSSGLIRSCSASNLCPGSWECERCSYINEPVGLDPRESCVVCGAHREGGRSAEARRPNGGALARQDSLRMVDLSPRTSVDDIGVNMTSWSQLVDVLAAATELSIDECRLPGT